jgi:aryl-phospho-beta-D-glucosidase BglC (GH1 family)
VSSGLHAVMGSGGMPGHIEDGTGKTIVLHGVDESGSENYCLTWGPPAVVLSPSDGPSPLDQTSITAMKSWGINAVRIPLNEDCWLGINGVDASVGGANYQAPIKQAVDLITQTNSMAVILDLHMSAPGTTAAKAQGTMPDVDHSVQFWQQVAAAYASNGQVIFDLFNEPVMMSGTMDQQFQCLKNGSTAPSSGDCPMVNFAVAGMQQLVTTVRGAGANNLIMVGGTGYASKLNLWTQYVPTDTLTPPNIAASWHVYDDQGGCTTDPATTLTTLCDPTTGLGAQSVLSAGYPIVVGETGYYSCTTGTTGSTWWPLFLSWCETQDIGQVAWSWSNGSTPQLLTGNSFMPNANGQIYQTYLSCIEGKTDTPAASCTTAPQTGCE